MLQTHKQWLQSLPKSKKRGLNIRTPRSYRPGQHTNCDAKRTMSFTLMDSDVSNWNVDAGRWAVTRGTFKVLVGASSRDIRLRGKITVA